MTRIPAKDGELILLERIFENNYHLHKDKRLEMLGKRRPKRLYKSLLEHPVDVCQALVYSHCMYVCMYV
jgi:hypothetical protein